MSVVYTVSLALAGVGGASAILLLAMTAVNMTLGV